MRGAHYLKSWSSTQKKVTLSSAEAELAACIKTSSEVIGILQMTAGLGRTVSGEVYVDSSAALAVVGRKGNGKLRHIRVGHLWVQQVAEDEVLAYRKVHGKTNPADICTKHVQQALMEAAADRAGMEFRGGRAEEGLEVSRLEKEEDPEGRRSPAVGRAPHIWRRDGHARRNQSQHYTHMVWVYGHSKQLLSLKGSREW